MAVTNGYESAGRLTATVMLNSSLTVLDSQQYGYNADNRRTSRLVTMAVRLPTHTTTSGS